MLQPSSLKSQNLLLAGSLRVAYPRLVPETVFESGPDYGGVTGLWALSARPGDESHAAVVLSFVSGSRTLSIAGAALVDFVPKMHLLTG